MKKFKVNLEEVFFGNFEVEAKNITEAKKLARKMLKENDVPSGIMDESGGYILKNVQEIGTYKKITSMAMLKREAKEGAEFFILLNGNIRSSKSITWGCCDKFHVLNWSDDTKQRLTPAQIGDRKLTNIGYAMSRGALFKEIA